MKIKKYIKLILFLYVATAGIFLIGAITPGTTSLEGTAIKSTGEAGATKFLREDGDGTCSWQTPAGSGDVSKVGTPADNQVGVWTGDGTIEGTSGLTYDGANFQLTGDIGSTGTRITKAWFTDLTVSNAIDGSITGNAATVTTITGLAPDTATTQATQPNITSMSNMQWTGMKTGVDGRIPTFDASGSPAFVDTGTDKQVLTSNGSGDAPTFQDTTISINSQTDSYTLVLSDINKLVIMSKETSHYMTVPANSSVAFPTGTTITVMQGGTGVTTIAAVSGVTIRYKDGLTHTGQYAMSTLIKLATDLWVLVGSLE